MRYFVLAVAVLALSIGASAAPAHADQALATSNELAAAQPRETTVITRERLAYDVDLSTPHIGRVVSQG